MIKYVFMSIVIIILVCISMFGLYTYAESYYQSPQNKKISESVCLYFFRNTGNYSYTFIMSVKCNELSDFSDSDLGELYMKQDELIIDQYSTANCPRVRLADSNEGVTVLVSGNWFCRLENFSKDRSTQLDNVKIKVNDDGTFDIEEQFKN